MSDGTLEERWEAIKNLEIGNFSAAPGHQVLRKPQSSIEIAEAIRGGTFKAEGQKPILNIITNSEGKIQSVDLWDGHHRMVGYYLAGKRHLNEFSADEFEILHNGSTIQGNTWRRILPSAGIDFSNSALWTEVPNDPSELRFWKVSSEIHSGPNTNREMGSIYSLADIAESNSRKLPYRVAVFQASPDHPIPSLSQFETIHQSGIQELLIVPNNPAYLKLYIKFAENYNRRHTDLYLNIYQGETVSGNTQQDAFVQRVSQIYATTDLPLKIH